MPNLPYTGRKGWWKLTKLNRASLLAYEVTRSPSAQPCFIFMCLCSCRSSRHKSTNSRLSRSKAKITLISLIATAQSISLRLGCWPTLFFVSNFEDSIPESSYSEPPPSYSLKNRYFRKSHRPFLDMNLRPIRDPESLSWGSYPAYFTICRALWKWVGSPVLPKTQRQKEDLCPVCSSDRSLRMSLQQALQLFIQILERQDGPLHFFQAHLNSVSVSVANLFYSNTFLSRFSEFSALRVEPAFFLELRAINSWRVDTSINMTSEGKDTA